MSDTNEQLRLTLASVGLIEGRDFWLKAGVLLSDCFGDRLQIGETYTKGLWRCVSLPDFFTQLRTNPRSLFCVLGRAAERGVVVQSAKDTAQHYNFGNDWYECMLGESMVYTSGLWFEGVTTLEQAQLRKMKKLFMKLGLKEGRRLLDIGGGWGALARLCAKEFGVEVHVLTIAEEQMKYGQKFCEGLPVYYHLLDYNHMTLDHFDGKPFDAVVTVEMMEHVGLPAQHVVFHQKIAQVLKPGGTLVHQVITTLKPVVDQWLNTYIFPGGVLLTHEEVEEVANKAGFVPGKTEMFGEHYPPTLLSWRNNLLQHKVSLMKRGYAEEHFRMFDYYLSLCAVMFATKFINLEQIVLHKG